MLQDIPIGLVRLGKRLRAVREGRVAALAGSIGEVGLLQPINVYRDWEMPEVGERQEIFRVVTGAHRYLACQRLGRTNIAAEVVEVRELDRRLMEIDENLIRAELSDLERAEHLAERKSVYEALHPEARRGGDRKSAEAAQKNQTADSAVRSFVADAAEKTGDAERTIRQAVRRAERIAPEVRLAIREGGVAHRGVDLDALTHLKPEEQVAAVALVRAGGAKNIRTAARAVKRPPSKPAADAQADEERQLAALKRGWTAHQQALRDAQPAVLARFVAWLEESHPELAAAIRRDGMPAFLVRKRVPHITLPVRRGMEERARNGFLGRFMV